MKGAYLAASHSLCFSFYQTFNTDKDGVTRPQGATWDVGAYQISVEPSRR
jgi:hypothetical protein